MKGYGKMKISVFSVLFAVVSILVAKFSASFAIPFLDKTLGLNQSQEQWVFILIVWAIGYWSYPLKNKIIKS